MRALQKLAPNAPALMILFAPADTARAGSPAQETGPVMEVVTFRLAPGVTDDSFLALARATEAPLRARPGLQSRILTRNPDGQWADHVLWSSLHEAMASADVMMTEPAFAPFMAAIDGVSITMRHDPIRWQMD